MSYRLIEFEMKDFTNHNGVTRPVKQIKNIFERDSRMGLTRYARKVGIKIRGNKLVEISEVPVERDCD